MPLSPCLVKCFACINFQPRWPQRRRQLQSLFQLKNRKAAGVSLSCQQPLSLLCTGSYGRVHVRVLFFGFYLTWRNRNSHEQRPVNIFWSCSYLWPPFANCEWLSLPPATRRDSHSPWLAVCHCRHALNTRTSWANGIGIHLFHFPKLNNIYSTSLWQTKIIGCQVAMGVIIKPKMTSTESGSCHKPIVDSFAKGSN